MSNGKAMPVDQPEDTVCMSSVLGVANTLRHIGMDPNRLLIDVGIDPATLCKTDQRVSIAALSEMISHAVDSELGPLFGLKFAKNVHATTYHSYGLMLLSAPTLRQFCQQLARYYSWVSTNKSVTFEIDGDTAQLIYHCQNEPKDTPIAHLARVSGWAATWVRLLRMAVSPNYCPKLIEFSSPAPLGFDEDYQKYFGCHPQFDDEVNALCFDSAVLDHPLPGGNARLSRICERQVYERLAQLDLLDLETRLRMGFINLLPTGKFSRSNLANWLGVTLDELHSMILMESLSYRSLLSDVRQEMASELVSGTDKSINEISYQLGFTDPSNFARSFRKWFGRCPTKNRALRG